MHLLAPASPAREHRKSIAAQCLNYRYFIIFQSLEELTQSSAEISVLSPAVAAEESVVYKKFVEAQEHYNDELAKVV